MVGSQAAHAPHAPVRPGHLRESLRLAIACRNPRLAVESVHARYAAGMAADFDRRDCRAQLCAVSVRAWTGHGAVVPAG